MAEALASTLRTPANAAATLTSSSSPCALFAAAAVAEPGTSLLHITRSGFGKRTPVEDYPPKGRGGLGVRGIKLGGTRKEVAGALVVAEDSEVFLIASSGTVIRMKVADISSQGRAATGVNIMSLDDGAHVASLAPVTMEDQDVIDDELAEIVDGDPDVGEIALTE